MLSFREFVTQVRPGYKWYRHCILLADVLQRVADGKIKRLMVFMPPRHGKSELVSRLFTAYFLYRYPERWVAITSYGADLAYTLSRAARDNFRAIGGELRGDAEAVKHWETTSGGGLWAAGVAGPATGKGWHLGVIDDPLKDAEQAASETIREKQKEWKQSVFDTREEPSSDADPDGAQIIVQTRWHADDLSGWTLEQELSEDDDDRENWHIVNFEAIKEEHTREFPPSCTVEPDWRQPGEALCPERRPLEKLRRLAKRLGGYFWNALFQQNPTPREGSFFKVSRLEIIDAAPAGLREVRGWDLGATEGAGDPTAGVKMGEKDSVFYITDVRLGQWGTDERDATIKQTAQLDGRPVRQRLPQEPAAAGKSLALAMTRLLAGFSVHIAPISGDKQIRADPFSSQVNAGNVKLVKGPWNKAFIEELRQFPLGKRDDQVDAASDAFSEITGKQTNRPVFGTLKRG